MTKQAGKLTAEEVSKLKNKHGRIYEVEVQSDTDGETFTAYFRRPTMDTLAAVSKLAKTNEIMAGKALVENCFVGGADEVKTDPALFLAVVGQLSGIFGRVRATIKNA